MKRICVLTTSPLIVNFFLVPHLLGLRRHHEVALAVNTGEPVALSPLPGIEVIAVPILRKIAPLQDLRTLWQLRRLFAERRFDAIHSYSPKAGLLAMVAGWLAGVPVRIHTFTGQVWLTRRGVMRHMLRWADKVTATAATHVLADSMSQMAFMVHEGIVSRSRCRVLGAGSVSGVDLTRFRPDPDAKRQWRTRQGLSEDARVALFLGRLTTDKGVLDLAAAFALVREKVPAAVLMFVGPDEENLRPRLLESAGRAAAAVIFEGYTYTPELFLAVADVLCLPSYREGFGSVIIEAAACGVPAVSTRIYGVTDAVVEDRTGLLHAPGDVGDLATKLASLLADDTRRGLLAAAARQRATTEFSQDRLASEMVAFYDEVLSA